MECVKGRFTEHAKWKTSRITVRKVRQWQCQWNGSGMILSRVQGYCNLSTEGKMTFWRMIFFTIYKHYLGWNSSYTKEIYQEHYCSTLLSCKTWSVPLKQMLLASLVHSVMVLPKCCVPVSSLLTSCLWKGLAYREFFWLSSELKLFTYGLANDYCSCTWDKGAIHAAVSNVVGYILFSPIPSHSTSVLCPTELFQNG